MTYGTDLQALPQHTDPPRRALLTHFHLRDFRHAISAPARIPRLVIAAVHSVAFGLALDALCAVDVRWAASDAVSSVKEVDVGLVVDTGALARVPKLLQTVSLLHGLALSARTFGAEEAQQSFGLVLRVVPCSRVEVVRAMEEPPLQLWGLSGSSLMHSIIRAFLFCFSVRFYLLN